MINIVEKATRNLEQLGEEKQMCNGIMNLHIEERLPKNMREEWVKLIAERMINSSQKFFELLKLIKQWKERIEYDSNEFPKVVREMWRFTSHQRLHKQRQ